jgi:hypothetical protein
MEIKMNNDTSIEDLCQSCGTIAHNGMYYPGHGYNCLPCYKNLDAMFGKSSTEDKIFLDWTVSEPASAKASSQKKDYHKQ